MTFDSATGHIRAKLLGKFNLTFFFLLHNHTMAINNRTMHDKLPSDFSVPSSFAASSSRVTVISLERTLGRYNINHIG